MAVTRRRPVAARPRNLLLEIGTEELPPKSLKSLGECFAGAVHEALNEAGVGPEGGESCRWYATPRRLAVWVGKVKPRQPDRIEERRGPSIRAAFDDHGMPTPAALGFARSCGVGVDKLGRQVTDQGEWLLFRRKVAGERIRDIVEQALEQAIRRLPIARRMRWGNGTEEFVRPVHWLLAMYGSEALKVSALGLKAGKWTYGHRFHSRGEIRIMSADRYLDTLKKQGLVIADYGERQQLIVRQVTRLARRNGGTAVLEPALLDEVTGLVEWPQALYGEFDRRFLKVPPEVLVSSMQDHQKYFHLEDGRGRLLPGFITVSNVRSRSPKRVRSGNERVLRARLADAEFFWLSDQKQPLESRRGALDRVLFHERLGSIGAKVERIRILALEIAGQVGANAEQVARACDLCKADLVTDLVGEFPELQGIVGGYYAAAGGEDRAVSNAIREHYKPRFAGDGLPRGRVSRCLALADRVDSLAGIFACGEIPSGDRDPYALRRAALGILRILIEERIELDLYRLIEQAMNRLDAHGGNLDASDETVRQVFGFVTDRLRAYYLSMGFDALEIAAVAAVAPRSPLDFHRRLAAVHDFFGNEPEAARSLASANKRIVNILAGQEIDEAGIPDAALLREPAEIALAKKLDKVGAKAGRHFAGGRYGRGLLALAGLKKPVDRFFDRVMVMDEDPAVRSNRLVLLAGIRRLFLAVADISVVRAE